MTDVSRLQTLLPELSVQDRSGHARNRSCRAAQLSSPWCIHTQKADCSLHSAEVQRLLRAA